MKSAFLSDFCIKLVDGDKIWKLHEALVYDSELLDCRVIVPEGFETDLASVPRVPVAYTLYGGKAHRESVIHDYLYRIDAYPVTSFQMANSVFLEAMVARNKPFYVRYPMYMGVCLGGRSSYHQKKVRDKA
jgi:hypothetical protein